MGDHNKETATSTQPSPSQELHCGKCSNVFTNPLMMPSCLHSFCKKCLEQQLKEQDSSAGSIKCPTCDTVSTLPSGSVASLPGNHWLAHQAEVSNYQQKIKDGASVSCGRCVEGSGGLAVTFCCSCCLFLCCLCQDDHRRFRETVSHELVSIGEKLDAVMPSCRPVMCSKHSKEELKFYCDMCQCLVCCDCIAMEHTNHTRVYAENVAEREKESLSSTLKEAENAVKELEAGISSHENIKKLIEAQGDEVREKIAEEFKTIYTSIQEREKALLDKCKKMTSHKLTIILSSEIDEMQTLKEKLTFSSMIAADSQSLTAAHLLSTKKPIHQYLQTRLASFARLDLESGENDDISVAFDKPAINEAVSKIGSILGGCDPVKCTVERGLAVPLVTCWSNMEVKVALRNSEDELVCEKVSLVGNLKGRDNIYNYERQAVVRFIGDGHALLCVSPPVVGEYDFTIKVKNKHIAHSPYKIRSRDRSPHAGITSSSKQMFYVDGSATGVAVHHNGDVFVAASNVNQHYVQVFSSDGTEKLQISQNYQLNGPFGLVIVGEVLYVVNSRYHRVLKFSLTGEYLSQFGSRGSCEGQFDTPHGICSDGRGHVLVADNGNNRIQVFNSDGKFISEISCYQPYDLAVDNKGNIHVSSSFLRQVKVYSPDGKQLSDCDTVSCLRSPTGVVVDEEGYRYVSDSYNHRICIFSPNGTLVSDSITCPSDPRCMALDNQGNIYVASYNPNCITKYRYTVISVV